MSDYGRKLFIASLLVVTFGFGFAISKKSYLWLVTFSILMIVDIVYIIKCNIKIKKENVKRR